MQTLLQDLRYGLRVLLKSPGFTIVAVLSLALGIGANTTIFTWFKAVALTPLPRVAQTSDLLVLTGRSKSGSSISVSYPDYVDIREQNQVFSGVIAYVMLPLSLGTEGRPERIYGQLVSGNFFEVLGVTPSLGRGFRPEEDRTLGTHPVAVLSHGLWQRRFGADPGLVGQTITLNGRSFTVIGVAPEGFAGTEVGLMFDIWVPLMMQAAISAGEDRTRQRSNHWLNAMVRLKPGVDLAQAQAGVDTLAAQLAQAYPESNTDKGVNLYPLWQSPRGGTTVLLPIVSVLMVVVGLVLLIACANVANLLLARAAGRQREVAIRLTLGAGRRRLVQQLLTESLLLAGLGGLVGLAVAQWSKNFLFAFVPPSNMPIGMDLGFDRTIFGFAFLLTLLTGAAFGLVPALQASKPELVTALKEESGAVAGGRRKARLRQSLVVAQVALSLLLLIGAGLFLRSMQQGQKIDPGFEPANLLLASLDLFPHNYDRAKGRVFYRQLLERLEAIPGVQTASVARKVPLGFGGTSSSSVSVEGYVPRPEEEMNVEYNNVGPNYFRAMGISLLQGREFSLQDDENAPNVMVINETMARRYWAGQSPLGRKINIGSTALTVIGVAKDGKYRTLNEAPRLQMYLPILQFYRTDATIHLRTTGDPATFAPAVRQTVQELSPSLPIFDIRPMTQHLGISVFPQRIGATFLGIFGLLALLLAAIGIYGVISYSVTQRTREIGIRLALGANAGDVLRLVVKQGMKLALLGVAIGLGAALVVTRLLASLLLGTSATDPTTFVGLTLLLTAVAGLACYLPARRATRVDPLTALRYE